MPSEPTRHKRLRRSQIHKGPVKLGKDPLQSYQHRQKRMNSPTQLLTDDVASIGDETFAIQLPSSANRPTINQRTRVTYIPPHCQGTPQVHPPSSLYLATYPTEHRF
ncbi:hypothetical protein CSKR_203170 [Clonorchis sinensis]|uniref:Uncharacterized protein n=1 Tax=Clonorchis sinensis TaxID=79923 RepID=A0A8T1M7Q8_CLOSI|nr:hypothetical protein CSKR_203170 [Clonorchis sinensis]